MTASVSPFRTNWPSRYSRRDDRPGNLRAYRHGCRRRHRAERFHLDRDVGLGSLGRAHRRRHRHAAAASAEPATTVAASGAPATTAATTRTLARALDRQEHRKGDERAARRCRRSS